MVKYVGFNRKAALFVGFCEGLLFFFSCLDATVDVLLSTAILVFRQRCGFHIYNKVQTGVYLSKLCLVFFLPLTFWCKNI